jgi:hypothetical protein
VSKLELQARRVEEMFPKIPCWACGGSGETPIHMEYDTVVEADYCWNCGGDGIGTEYFFKWIPRYPQLSKKDQSDFDNDLPF